MNSARIKNLTSIFTTSPGYLEQTGWLRSLESGRTVDKDGRPIPWLTYPSLDFFSALITPGMSVFEYGSGNSTLWWGKRVARLVSCEHDKEWYASLKKLVANSDINADTTCLLRRCKGGSSEYGSEILHYRDAFDILVIDGRDRVGCARNGLGSLRAGGVIVWDNSDRDRYLPGYIVLQEAGFRRLDFWGMGPLSTRRWCTSIFYRDGNCFGI